MRLDFRTGRKRLRLGSFGDFAFEINPSASFAGLLFPLLDSLRRGVRSHAPFEIFKRHVGEALTMEADELRLVTVMASRAEDLTTHATDGDRFEITLWHFEFDVFDSVVFVDDGAVEDVRDGFITREKEPAIGRGFEKRRGTCVGA